MSTNSTNTNGNRDLPMFPHPSLHAGNFNSRHVDWGENDTSPDGKCLVGWASFILAFLYNSKDTASFYSVRWNTDTNRDLVFTSVGSYNRIPDERPSKHCSIVDLKLRYQFL